MFVRQGTTPLVLLCVSAWFEVYFPVAHLARLLPLFLHLPPPGLHFLLLSGMLPSA